MRRDREMPRNVDIDVVRWIRGVHDHHARNVDGVLTYGQRRKQESVAIGDHGSGRTGRGFADLLRSG